MLALRAYRQNPCEHSGRERDTLAVPKVVRASADAHPTLFDLFGFGVGHVLLHLREHLFSVVLGNVPRNFPLRRGVSLAKRSQLIFDAFVGEKEIRAFQPIASGLRSFNF